MIDGLAPRGPCSKARYAIDQGSRSMCGFSGTGRNGSPSFVSTFKNRAARIRLRIRWSFRHHLALQESTSMPYGLEDYSAHG